MCGIVGVWRRDGTAVSAERLRAMLATMPHRGPDHEGVWVGEGVGLGHVRLSILDPSPQAHQPMRSRHARTEAVHAGDARSVLVLNGALYNFVELREALVREGASFRSTGDTEVMLAALERWGVERAVERFAGMFTFAYVDRREGALWLGRDRMGIKPLHLYEHAQGVVFASEVKALLAHPEVPCEPNVRGLDRKLLMLPDLESDRAFRKIHLLEPGCVRRFDTSGEHVHTFFAFPQAVDLERLRASARAPVSAAVEAFGGALEESVVTHLRSDVPQAAIISGGVDSSLTAALALRDHPTMEAYVADVGGEVSEAAQAQRVADHLGMPLHVVAIERENFLDAWPAVIWHRDGYSNAASDVALYLLTQRCHQDGVRVLLTGEGSDELFAGYAWQRATWRRWRRAYRLRHVGWPFDVGGVARWKRHAARAHVGDRPRRDDDLYKSLGGHLRAAARQVRSATREHLEPLGDPPAQALVHHMLDDLRNHLASILFRHDRMAMAWSIETRIPFLANRVLDVGLHTAPRHKVRRGQGKWPVKAYAERLLPKEVVHAPKQGFPVRAVLWEGSMPLLRGGVLPELLEWSRTLAEAQIEHFARFPATAYRLASMEMWGRLFLRGDSIEQVRTDLRRAVAGDSSPR